jgi:hypothetical protein
MTFEEMIADTFALDQYSPYALAKKLSELRGCYVREQMVYQYCAKPEDSSLHIATTRNGLGKKQVAREECIRFAVKYLTKNAPELVKQFS